MYIEIRIVKGMGEMLFNNELIIQTLSFATPIVSLIGWILSQNNNIFNSKKIQNYELRDFQHTVIFYQYLYIIINPALSMATSIGLWNLFAKINPDVLRDIIFLEWYLVFLIIVSVIEFGVLNRKKRKIEIVSTSISEEVKSIVMATNKKKWYIFIALIINFYFIGVILYFNFLSIELLNAYIAVEIVIYALSIVIMSFRVSIYKSKVKIKSNTIIRMDYRKDYGCYCNIVLKKEFSCKLQDNNIIIYFPGDISSYTIKQDNLISITVGYRVEYLDVKENKYIGTFNNI